MNAQETTHEERVQCLIETWDSLIDDLKETSRVADTPCAQDCNEAISLLIAGREAVRRGLIAVKEDMDACCAGCCGVASDDAQVAGDSAGAVERILSGDFEVTRSPKRVYGPGE